MDNPIAGLAEYELRHLVEHLEEAGRDIDIHHLLALETKAQRNAWFEAREANSDSEGYLADIGRAGRLAKRSYLPTQDTDATQKLGLECRYALITTTFSSIAQHVLPELIQALIEKQVWSVAQGLSYARHAPSPKVQIPALSYLSGSLPESMRELALREASRTRTIEGPLSWI